MYIYIYSSKFEKDEDDASTQPRGGAYRLTRPLTCTPPSKHGHEFHEKYSAIPIGGRTPFTLKRKLSAPACAYIRGAFRRSRSSVKCMMKPRCGRDPVCGVSRMTTLSPMTADMTKSCLRNVTPRMALSCRITSGLEHHPVPEWYRHRSG